jgi:hypothetical protein
MRDTKTDVGNSITIPVASIANKKTTYLDLLLNQRAQHMYHEYIWHQKQRRSYMHPLWILQERHLCMREIVRICLVYNIH